MIRRCGDDMEWLAHSKHQRPYWHKQLTLGLLARRVLDSEERDALYFLTEPSALDGLEASSVEVEAESGRLGVNGSVLLGFIMASSPSRSVSKCSHGCVRA